MIERETPGMDDPGNNEAELNVIHYELQSPQSQVAERDTCTGDDITHLLFLFACTIMEAQTKKLCEQLLM